MDKFLVINTETGKREENYSLWVVKEEKIYGVCRNVKPNYLVTIIDDIAKALTEACDVTKEEIFETILSKTEEKHEPKVEITVFENEILKSAYAHGYEWIARDEFGNELDVYEHKPYKETLHWNTDHGKIKELSLLEEHFRFIKWEDEEPVHIPTLLENAKIIEEGE